MAIVLLIVGAIGAYFYPQPFGRDNTKAGSDKPRSTSAGPKIQTPSFDQTVEKPVKETPTPTITGDGGIGKLRRERTSDVIVTAGGTVAKVLPDDDNISDGSGWHQRFIIRLATGDTVLIAHNIDLAGRVPAHEGDVIQFKGEYEWTERGGVVHWTHHDPQNRRQSGWIELNGKQYK